MSLGSVNSGPVPTGRPTVQRLVYLKYNKEHLYDLIILVIYALMSQCLIKYLKNSPEGAKKIFSKNRCQKIDSKGVLHDYL